MANGYGQRSVDNPNDEAIRETQKGVRLQVGARAAQLAGNAVLKPQFGEAMYFRFRKHVGTQFGGLWELAVVDSRGKVIEIVTDADALPHVLEAIGNIFANQGF